VLLARAFPRQAVAGSVWRIEVAGEVDSDSLRHGRVEGRGRTMGQEKGDFSICEDWHIIRAIEMF
jgi:hypothetical protein